MGEPALGNSICETAIPWPAIIFVIFAIISLVAILFATGMDTNSKAWSFFGALIAYIIWGAILYCFCRAGYHALSWFLLLLPLGVAIFGYLSVWISSVTTPANCVAGGAMTKSVL